ncbi:hypothetical protein pb186bvf_015536 [Paramecium bursaria]
MRTFFTDLDGLQEKDLLKEIQQLQLRMNFDSPRTQKAIMKLGYDADQCQLLNLNDFHHFKNDQLDAYREHLLDLVEKLRQIVYERRFLVGPSVRIFKHSNSKMFMQKLYDQNLKDLYHSELQIKEQQLKNNKRIQETIQQKFNRIVQQAQKHNERVNRKLSMVREKQKYDLDNRYSKSMDFGSKFDQIEQKLSDTKVRFKEEKKMQNQLSFEIHQSKKQKIVHREENERTNLQNSVLMDSKYQFQKHFKTTTDKIDKANQLFESSTLRKIQKIGFEELKSGELTNKLQFETFQNIQKQKSREELKHKRAKKIKNSLINQQSQREQAILSNLTEKLGRSEEKVKQRVQEMQDKIKSAHLTKQQKQQELIQHFIRQQDRQNQKILNKHIKIRTNLRSNDMHEINSRDHIISKDNKFKSIETEQRKIVGKNTDNILQLLNKLNK